MLSYCTSNLSVSFEERKIPWKLFRKRKNALDRRPIMGNKSSERYFVLVGGRCALTIRALLHGEFQPGLKFQPGF